MVTWANQDVSSWYCTRTREDQLFLYSYFCINSPCNEVSIFGLNVLEVTHIYLYHLYHLCGSPCVLRGLNINGPCNWCFDIWIECTRSHTSTCIICIICPQRSRINEKMYFCPIPSYRRLDCYWSRGIGRADVAIPAYNYVVSSEGGVFVAARAVLFARGGCLIGPEHEQGRARGCGGWLFSYTRLTLFFLWMISSLCSATKRDDMPLGNLLCKYLGGVFICMIDLAVLCGTVW